MWLLKKRLLSREQPDSSLSIVNNWHIARVLLVQSAVARSIHVAMIGISNA